MPNYIEQLVKDWADDEMTAVNLKVDHLEKRLFKSYEPNKFIDGEFWARCEEWLKNVNTDEEKKALFRLLTQLFYVGPSEFEELFRCAYDGPIARWLAEKKQIDVCAPGAQQALCDAAEQTWFCPVTDSFRINSFFHVNNLPANANLRPDWCSLHRLADIDKLKQYCSNEGIHRLVLLEDFVGGGSQSLGAVEFAATQIQDLDVLFVPMIICPDGANAARALVSQLNLARPGGLSFDPVLELPRHAFFTAHGSPFSGQETAALRQVVQTTYQAVSGGVPAGAKPYDMYGFPPNSPTGGLVVMYTNTPDNTLPLVHWRPKTNTWQPVFPRHSRV